MHSNGVRNLVFLGGSCNPTTWRTKIAIPYLEKAHVNYYNPQVSSWRHELIEKENNAKETAGVLLFVIDNQTRAVAAMTELAELAAGNRMLVVVMSKLMPPHSLVCGQTISTKEHQELKHAQLVIRNLLERRGVPVFSDLTDALDYTVSLIKRHYSTDELIRRFVQSKSMLKASTKMVKLREIFRSLDVANLGEISLPSVQYAYRRITGCDVDDHMIRTVIFYQQRCSLDYAISENNHDLRLNFEQFCCLVAIHEHQQQQIQMDNRTKSIAQLPHRQTVQLQSSYSRNKHVNTHIPHGQHMILRPLQWIFDWFSGVNSSHSDHRLDDDRLITHTASPILERNRHPPSVQRLDSVQSVYANQTGLSCSGNNMSTVTSHNNSFAPGDLLMLSQGQAFNVFNGRISSQYASDRKHVYPFQVECRDVYLGGTGLPSRWREEIAIPILRKCHLTFYYQYEDSYNENISSFEASAILNSRILLFVITSESRSLSSMLMASHFIAKGYAVILCIQYLPENYVIAGETISPEARKDYNRSRDYLNDLAKRYSVPVFKEVHQAVSFAHDKIKELKHN